MGRMRDDALLLVKVILLLLPFLHYASSAQLCGFRASGAQCQSGYCCGTSGYCERIHAYCGEGNCGSHCSSSPRNVFKSKIGEILTRHVYNCIIPRGQQTPKDGDKSGLGYRDFIQAASFFGTFGTTGNSTTRKREIAAFFAHVYYETDGYNTTTELNPASNYCDSSSTEYPCTAGKAYYGRGPFKLTWNYNYGPAGEAIGKDLLNSPELVVEDPVVAFQTALWFWTTAQPPYPSCHDVMDDTWSPSPEDRSAQRLPGFGVTISIFNGEKECGPDAPGQAEALERISLFKKFSAILGVDTGSNVDCGSLEPYSSPVATY